MHAGGPDFGEKAVMNTHWAKKTRWLLAALLAVLLFICAACGQAQESSGTSVQAPASSSSAPAEKEPEPQPASTSKVEYLTGLPKGDDYPEGQRIGAVMVNNIAVCRPLSGLSEADVLVEAKVEGGITRFMALYKDYKTIPRVGPVRSSRDQFFQLLLPSYGFLVHIGESVVQREYRQNWDYSEFDIDGDFTGDIVAWDKDRRAAGFAQEHTAYTDGGLISAHVESADLDDRRTYNSSFFNFHAPTAPAFVPTDSDVLHTGSAAEVEIIHSPNYTTYFTYNTEAHLYEMSMYNLETKLVEPTVDEGSGRRLAFENVIVAFAGMEAYTGHEDKDLQKVTFGQGVGVYFTEGAFMPIMWKKEGPQDPLRIYEISGDGKQVEVNPGKSYLALVDEDEWSGFWTKVYGNGQPREGTSAAGPGSGAGGAPSSESGSAAGGQATGGGEDETAESGPMSASDISDAAKSA